MMTCASATLAIGACSSDSSNDGGDAGGIVTDIGQCPTSYDASADKFPHAALPAGQACTAGTTCHIPIDDCPSDWSENPVGPNLNEYECLCANGAWSCTLAVKVDTSCGAPQDAGTDSALDAGDDAPIDSPIDVPLDGSIDSPIDSPADAPIDANDGSLADANGDAADAL